MAGRSTWHRGAGHGRQGDRAKALNIGGRGGVEIVEEGFERSDPHADGSDLGGQASGK